MVKGLVVNFWPSSRPERIQWALYYLQKFDAIRIQIVDPFFDLLLLPLGKRRLVVAQFIHVRPVRFVRRTERSKDSKQLIDLRIAGEQAALCAHLGQDAAQTPDVHAGRIVFGAQQDLRRPVPKRDHLVRVFP